jgi:protocatechuate 3,4-dioxygenase beta subunit
MNGSRLSRRRRIGLLSLAAVAIALASLALERSKRRPVPGADLAADGSDAQRVETPLAIVIPAVPSRATFSGAIYADGTALAGATVCGYCASCNLLLADSSPVCTASDSDGRYELERFAAGEYIVSAAADGYAPKAANGGKAIVVAEDDMRTITNLDIELEQGGAPVTGTVLDVTGGPVAGAAVQATSGLTEWSIRPMAHRTITDGEGRFTLSAPAGRITLLASADGYAPGFANRTAPTSGVQVILTPSSSMSGSVITEEGQPVGNITVTARTQTDSMRSATTDQAGRFALSGLSPGVYQVRALGKGWIGDSTATVTLGLADAVRDVTITVNEAVSIRGTLLAEDRSVCAHGRVHIGPGPGDFSIPVLDAASASDGTVSLEGVLPGTYKVSVACGGPDFQPAQPLEVGTTDQSGLVWHARRQLGISGRVVDSRGRPVSKLLFELRSVNTKPVLSRGIAAGADGGFSCNGLAAGEYVLQSPHFVEPVSVQLHAQSVTDVTLVTKAVGYIAVHVVSPSGESLDSLTITATAPDGTVTDFPEEMGNGTYRLGPMPEGSYAVHASDGVNPRVQAGGPAGAIAVRAGETTQVAVTYGGYQGRIAGRVLDDLGAPVENVWVHATPSDHPGGLIAELQRIKVEVEARRRLTDAEGRFEIGGLVDTGVFTVNAEWPLGGAAKVEGVKPGSSVDLVLQSLGRLAGIAVDAKGEPAVHLSVQLSNSKTGQRRNEVIFAADGKWQLDDVTPGPIQIVASDSNRNVAIANCTLSPKQTLRDLRLELRPHMGQSPRSSTTNDNL